MAERAKVFDKGQPRTFALVLALAAVVVGVAVYAGARAIGGVEASIERAREPCRSD